MNQKKKKKENLLSEYQIRKICIYFNICIENKPKKNTSG